MVRSTRMGKKRVVIKRSDITTTEKNMLYCPFYFFFLLLLLLPFSTTKQHTFSDSSSPGARTKPNNIKVGRFISQRKKKRTKNRLDKRVREKENLFVVHCLLIVCFTLLSAVAQSVLKKFSFRSSCELAHRRERAGKLALIGWSFEPRCT